MKKLLLCLFASLMVLGVVACSDDTTETGTPEISQPETEQPDATPPATENPEVTGDLEELIGQIYSATDAEFPNNAITAINDENIEYFLGTSDIAYDEAIASEPMISSIAHSVVLLRATDGADIEDIKTKIKENADPRKWICVGVEEDEVIVDNIGNLVILIMDKNSEALQQSFLALAK